MSQVNPIQLQKYLKGVDYPANREALLANAKKWERTKMSTLRWNNCRTRISRRPPT